MLSKVEVRTSQGVLLTLDLNDISNGYVVEDIAGLDPVEATLVTSSFANLDGEQFQSAKRGKRNIVFKLGYEPDFSSEMTVSQLRSQLYGFFMPKSQVFLRFFADGFPPVDIAGRVETFVSPLFVKDPTATISIINFNSDFVGDEVILPGSTVSSVVNTAIDYDGTIETGFLFTMNVNRSISAFSIYVTGADGSQAQLDFAGALASGDVLKISTVPGNKYATLTHLGSDSSILYGVSPYSSWLTLFPGVNQLRVVTTGAAIPYTIDYTNKYGGL